MVSTGRGKLILFRSVPFSFYPVVCTTGVGGRPGGLAWSEPRTPVDSLLSVWQAVLAILRNPIRESRIENLLVGDDDPSDRWQAPAVPRVDENPTGAEHCMPIRQVCAYRSTDACISIHRCVHTEPKGWLAIDFSAREQLATKSAMLIR